MQLVTTAEDLNASVTEGDSVINSNGDRFQFSRCTDEGTVIFYSDLPGRLYDAVNIFKHSDSALIFPASVNLVVVPEGAETVIVRKRDGRLDLTPFIDEESLESGASTLLDFIQKRDVPAANSDQQ